MEIDALGSSCSAPTISSTEPMGVSSSARASSWLENSDLIVPLPQKSCGTSLQLVEGAGKGTRATSSGSNHRAVLQRASAEEDPEDLYPLTRLLEDSDGPSSVTATHGTEVNLDNAIEHPMVLFEGKFDNGRTLYSQVLWPDMTRHDAQVELNRD
eukprot:5257613-Amphidinium_carterae.1